MTEALTDQDEYQAISKNGTYKFFRNIGSATALVLLSLFIIEFFPGLDGLPPAWIIQAAIAILIVTWLAWDTIHSLYGRLSTSLTKEIATPSTEGGLGPEDLLIEDRAGGGS